MKISTRTLACLPPGLIATLLLAACIGPQGRGSDRNPLAPDAVEKAPLNYYTTQLQELPMRIQSYDLTGRAQNKPVAIRQLYLRHDDVRDEILVVDADGGQNHLWSIDPYHFTLHWRTPIEKRVDFEPLATSSYVVLINSDGEYQAFDRLSAPRRGESRLVSKGRYENDIFPSTQPASNDSHVYVPATNTNSIRGFSINDNVKGYSSLSWTFPNPASRGDGSQRFMQISLPVTANQSTVAIVNNNLNLYLLDAQAGELRAAIPLGAHSRTPPVIKDDLVFVGNDRGELSAWEQSGESAWVIAVDGIPYGDIVVENGWVFVRTLEVYDREVSTMRGRGTTIVADTRPGKLMAYRYEVIDIPGDRPVFRVIDGDPSTAEKVEPIWSEPDVGQKVLTLNGDYLFVLYEENEEFLSKVDLAKLRQTGRIVSKREELRTVSRRLQVKDVNSGLLARPEWDINLRDFPFVVGSGVSRDLSVYLGTSDGYIFRLHRQDRAGAGGK